MRQSKDLRSQLQSAAAVAAVSLAAFTSLAQPYPTAVTADHPMAYWRLQETSGTLAHDSAGTYQGTFTNVQLGLQGYVLGSNPSELAVGFGPTASQTMNSFVAGIPLDVASSANTNFSVEAWVNGTYQTIGAGIISRGTGGGGDAFALDCGGASGAFRFYVRNASGAAFNASGSAAPDGNWHHVVGVCDEVNGFIYLYVDGQVSAVHSATGGIQSTPGSFVTIGARRSSASSEYDLQFDGLIGEVAVYNSALSTNQVQAHYFAAGIPPTLTQVPDNFITVNEGSSLSLPAAATGSSPLAYQWTANGSPLNGQTNATLLLTNVPFSLNGSLLVLTVTNSYGSASTPGTSLYVNSGAPQLVTDVRPTQAALYQGSSFTYSVAVTGTEPFTYQWFHNGGAIAGANSSSYALTVLPGTNTYSVTISNAFNGGSVTPSSTATMVGVALPTASYPARILQDHPIAFWRLDEAASSTDAYDYAGGHNGIYSAVQLGLPGYSAAFDSDTAAGFGSLQASDSYMGETDNSGNGQPLVDFAQPQGSNVAFSVEAWVKGPPTQNSAGSGIVVKGPAGSEEFILDASGPANHFRFLVRKAGSGGTSTIFSTGSYAPDNSWHHLVGVCDEPNGAMYFYVDGVNMGTITGIGGGGIYSSSVPLSIGAQPAGGGYADQFVGTIDEVAMYNYALSPEQVGAHFNAAPIAPYFTQVPPTNVLTDVGQTVVLTATALGSAPITNQWLLNGSPLSGQNGLTLTLTDVAAGTNVYTLRVSNAYGITNTTTTVQVPLGSGPPQLVTDLKPLVTTRYAGLPLTYTVAASGRAPLSYQWYFGAQPLANATSASLTLPSLASTDAGTYHCVITNSLGMINSSTATLAVVPGPTNAYSLRIIADHPLAYYRMDETTGSAIGYDYVGGNNGYYSNAVFGTTGAFGSLYDANAAVSFGASGVQNSLLGAALTNLDFSVPNGQNGAFSIEAWVKGTPGFNQLSGGGILAKGTGNGDEQFALDAHFGYRFYVRNAAGVTVAGAQGAPTLGGAYVGSNWQMDGQWHHLVGVCDQVNSNILLYVDGTLIGPNVITNGVVPPLVYALDQGVPSTGTNGVIYQNAGIRKQANTGAAYWNADSVSIGSRNRNASSAGYTLNFNGAIDEAAFYNYALSPLQVSNHFAVAKQMPIGLSAKVANGHPNLTWPDTYPTATLLSAPTLSGPWSTVPNAASPFSVTNAAPSQFYRLKLF